MPTPLINTGSPSLVPVTGRPFPLSLFDIIAWVESKNNPHAMRFEPGVYSNVLEVIPGDLSVRGTIMKTIKTANKCSDGTARMIHCTSFGATQIMGFNLYNGLYTGDVASFMGDPVAQAVAFDSFCAAKQIKCSVADIAGYPLLRAHFAKLYNGDADAYSAQIVYALQHFGIAVTQ